MHARLTRHRRTCVEEQCWKDEQRFHCVRSESSIDRTQNCGTLADCWHKLEARYPLIEMRASRCRQRATLSQLSGYCRGISESAYLSLLALTCSFDAIATLDYVCLKRYRPRSAMKLEEKAACIAEDRSQLVPSPERCRRCSTVLAYRL